MWNVVGYKCCLCGEEYRIDEVDYICPNDQANLDIILNISSIKQAFSPEAIQSSPDYSMWRYIPLLPVQDPSDRFTPLRSVGWTPLYRSSELEKRLGIRELWLKDDSRNPTASLKDRASALVIARARELEADVIITASTGNAGAALAGIAAAVGQRCAVLVPKDVPKAKLTQLLVYGAQVIQVDGNYDDAVKLALAASKELGWYCRNTGYNPFTLEGKKTVSFEIWEQLLMQKNLSKKLSIFVPVGDGNIISGVYKGFKDLLDLGWLNDMPRIFGVQSERSAAIANAFDVGDENILAINADTIADSISVDMPSDGLRALRAVSKTGGAYIKVSDEKIIDSIAHLGSVGVFAEPAAAAAYAGLDSALESGLIKQDDPSLLLITGSGLKDVSSVQKALPTAPIIPISLKALKKVLIN